MKRLRKYFAPQSRSPHGERGLKSCRATGKDGTYGSLPPRGAWIEITIIGKLPKLVSSRSPHGERGLKFFLAVIFFFQLPSLPPRGAWIEMPIMQRQIDYCRVAPPTGSVD